MLVSDYSYKVMYFKDCVLLCLNILAFGGFSYYKMRKVMKQS